MGVPERVEEVFLLLEHLAANGRATSDGADEVTSATFSR
jgi:hypothetical protein